MTDGPARIVNIASRILPPERRAWGDAMSAELAGLGDVRARWSFAFGCARAVLSAPSLPDAGILRAVGPTFIGGIVAALAVTAYVLATWPHASRAISPTAVIWFAIGLGAFLWVGVRPPTALVSHRSAARRGVATGFFLFVVTAIGRAIIDAASLLPDDDLLIGLFLAPTVAGTIAFTAFRVARRDRSFVAGVVASLWVGLVCSILAFNADMVATLAGFNHHAHVLGTMPKHAGISVDAFLDIHIGDHLAASMQAVKNLPVLAVLLGSIASAIGRVRRAHG